MCTAVGDSNFFGRTLDIDRSYGEEVILTPRKFAFNFLHEEMSRSHFAIMGMACEAKGIPLYFDAVNEQGLCIAGLNFPENAVYHQCVSDKHNVASFELIPWVLCRCATIEEAAKLLSKTNITADSFSADLPTTPLHWIVTDGSRSLTVESVVDGLKIYENPFGVLTNNPPFPYHISHVAEYMHLSPVSPKNTLCPHLCLEEYSFGFGALGLPGDFSSASRFIRAVFLKNHASVADDRAGEINRFFHIMDSVGVPKGCVINDAGREHHTVYTSCIDRGELSYHFTTYDCRKIRGASMKNSDLDACTLFHCLVEESIFTDNHGRE